MQVLCKGFPLEFVKYFQYCRSLRFDDKRTTRTCGSCFVTFSREKVRLLR